MRFACLVGGTASYETVVEAENEEQAVRLIRTGKIDEAFDPFLDRIISIEALSETCIGCGYEAENEPTLLGDYLCKRCHYCGDCLAIIGGGACFCEGCTCAECGEGKSECTCGGHEVAA